MVSLFKISDNDNTNKSATHTTAAAVLKATTKLAKMMAKKCLENVKYITKFVMVMLFKLSKYYLIIFVMCSGKHPAQQLEKIFSSEERR